MKMYRRSQLLISLMLLNSICVAFVHAEVCTTYKHGTGDFKTEPCATIASVYCRDAQGHVFRSENRADGTFQAGDAACKKQNNTWTFTRPRANTNEKKLLIENADYWKYNIWVAPTPTRAKGPLPTNQEIDTAEKNLVNLGKLLSKVKEELQSSPMQLLKEVLSYISKQSGSVTTKTIVDTALTDFGAIAGEAGIPGVGLITGLLTTLYNVSEPGEPTPESPKLIYDEYVLQIEKQVMALHDKVNAMHTNLRKDPARYWATSFKNPITNKVETLSVFGSHVLVPSEDERPTTYTELKRRLVAGLVRASWRHFVKQGFYVSYWDTVPKGPKYPFPVCLMDILPTTLKEKKTVEDLFSQQMSANEAKYLKIVKNPDNGKVRGNFVTWTYYAMKLSPKEKKPIWSRKDAGATIAKYLFKYVYRKEKKTFVYCRDAQGHVFRSEHSADGTFQAGDAACKKQNNTWTFTRPRGDSNEKELLIKNADYWKYNVWVAPPQTGDVGADVCTKYKHGTGDFKTEPCGTYTRWTRDDNGTRIGLAAVEREDLFLNWKLEQRLNSPNEDLASAKCNPFLCCRNIPPKQQLQISCAGAMGNLISTSWCPPEPAR